MIRRLAADLLFLAIMIGVAAVLAWLVHQTDPRPGEEPATIRHHDPDRCPACHLYRNPARPADGLPPDPEWAGVPDPEEE